MSKMILLFVIAIATIGLSLPQQVAAQETQDTNPKKQLGFTKEQLDKVKQNMESEGVISSDTQIKLLDKLSKGEALDSFVLPEEKAVDTIKKDTDNGYEITYIFSDGSYTQAAVDEPDFSVAGVGIKDGKCQGGSGYQNCTSRKVYYNNNGTFSLSFKASYSLVQGGFDSITSAGKWSIWTVTGSYANPKMRIIRKKETDFKKAEARLSATLNIGGGIGSITRSVSLIVGKDKAKAQGNTYY
ncbi:hypothetical protein P9738_16205 [Bacillus siamensis]|uniref:hypothetical protein n=1 Tax=Bacillus siamensis TaxID=659243 RepID=UPI002E224304|nr:hypothetical protein [Bacillus siamensis]MED5097685.1 hypothetical protein [Bacillus siamensis]